MGHDPFDVLGLPPRFDLDIAEIERAYFARSAALHPDVAAGDDDAQRRMAVLNQARRTLDDPERRANALLARLGGPASAQDKSLPPAFLMEMMEVREAVEEAVNEPDPARRRSERMRWESWAEVQRLNSIREVTEMFQALGTSPAPDDLRAIRTRLNAWRYIERLIEQLDPDYDPKRSDFER
jgi:molecular chaperone HscB